MTVLDRDLEPFILAGWVVNRQVTVDLSLHGEVIGYEMRRPNGERDRPEIRALVSILRELPPGDTRNRCARAVVVAKYPKTFGRALDETVAAFLGYVEELN